MNHPAMETQHGLASKISSRTATVGIIGLGYVGLPLAAACARAGFQTVGFDIDETKIEAIGARRSYIDAVDSQELARLVDARSLRATIAFEELASCDIIVICVPTPLGVHREPDLQYVENTTRTIARFLKADQIVVLESTTYPGTTEEIVRPILEQSGLRSGQDFFLGFSPEREDPGNRKYTTTIIPKVTSGDGETASTLVGAFYEAVFDQVVAVSAPRVAEAVKITENIFRAVNIALVNELKVIYDAMGIDIWEVIDAASTKPFGYMPFYPGPGLGGHCIPIDPFYLTWKSQEYGLRTRFIELAGEINTSMPLYVVAKLERLLDRTQKRSLGSARILLVGIAYKKNVSDVRESASFEIMRLLEQRGAGVEFHDPLVETIPPMRRFPELAGRSSVGLTPAEIERFDAILIATDHDSVDYALLSVHARLIVDTRNALEKRGLATPSVFKA
ncbi:nucleotide sugar dehydrogenase [Aquibium oceanicum]|nr:nucleotide sugar dehydrogenase [Aquibium oceanicum]